MGWGWKKYRNYAKKLLVDPYKRPYQSMKGIYTGIKKGEGFEDVMSRAARPIRKGAGGAIIGAVAPVLGKAVGGYFAGKQGAEAGKVVGAELGKRFEEAASRDLTSEVEARRDLLESQMRRFQSPMAEAWQTGRRYMDGMQFPPGYQGMASRAMMRVPPRMPYGNDAWGGAAGMLTSAMGDPKSREAIFGAAGDAWGSAKDWWTREPEPPTFDPGSFEDWDEAQTDMEFEELMAE